MAVIGHMPEKGMERLSRRVASLQKACAGVIPAPLDVAGYECDTDGFWGY